MIGGIIVLINTPEARKIQEYLIFPPNMIIYVFLPIIIFEASYYLNRNAFISNFPEIFSFATVGTVLSTLIIGYSLFWLSGLTLTKLSFSENMTYASLVSSIDPVAVIAVMESMHVNDDLFYVCFGESTMNDGVAIVLYNLFMSL